MRDGYLVCLEQMSRKVALKWEVSDEIRKVTLGAFTASRIDGKKAEHGRNRHIRNRMYGGEDGRRAQALLLPDKKLFRLQECPLNKQTAYLVPL